MALAVKKVAQMMYSSEEGTGTNLVHGILGDDLETSQGVSQMHEHDGDRPQCCYGKNPNERVYPDCRSCNLKLNAEEQRKNQKHKCRVQSFQQPQKRKTILCGCYKSMNMRKSPHTDTSSG